MPNFSLSGGGGDHLKNVQVTSNGLPPPPVPCHKMLYTPLVTGEDTDDDYDDAASSETTMTMYKGI